MKQHPLSNAARISDMEALVGQKLEDVEKALILATLSRCGGNRTWAADILGISVRTLRNKLLRYRQTAEASADAAGAAETENESYIIRLKRFEPAKRLPS